MKRKIPYGMANYADLIRDNTYFVDKTHYIAQLEQVNNPIFLRPRRFGKSLLCSMLRYYYDLNYADRFEQLFGKTWIGQHPTGNQNQYFVLRLNFSTIHVGRTVAEIEASFRNQCNDLLDSLPSEYALLAEMPEIDINAPVSDMLRRVLNYIRVQNLPPMFVTIDEYDNFTNQLVAGNRDQLYRALTADDSFLKTFFKTLKEGREIGAIANVYITGVLPILIDDMASGFNIGSFLTLGA